MVRSASSRKGKKGGKVHSAPAAKEKNNRILLQNIMPSVSSNRVKNPHELLQCRRDLRTKGTAAEGALWKVLRAKQINGLQFRRQYGVENYVLDFYCPRLQLAIELDGEVHENFIHRHADQERDSLLWERHGIKVLRYENKMVYENIKVIINDILKFQNAVEGENAE